MSDSITLSEEELFALTGYEVATKQLKVLRERGFVRAFISRKGVVLERTHYEAVTKGQVPQELRAPGKVANLSHFRPAA